MLPKMSFPHGPSSSHPAKIDQLNLVPCEQSYAISPYLLNGDSAHQTTISLKTSSDNMVDLSDSDLASERDTNGYQQNVITNGESTTILCTSHLNLSSTIQIPSSPLNHDESRQQQINSNSKQKGKFWILSNSVNNNNNNDLTPASSESDLNNSQSISNSVEDSIHYVAACDSTFSSEVNISSVLDSKSDNTKSTKRRGRPKKALSANTENDNTTTNNNNENENIALPSMRTRRSTRLKILEDKKESTTKPHEPPQPPSDSVHFANFQVDDCSSDDKADLQASNDSQASVGESISHDTTTILSDKKMSKSKSSPRHKSKNKKSCKSKYKREKAKPQKQEKETNVKKQKVPLSITRQESQSERFATPLLPTSNTHNDEIDPSCSQSPSKSDSEDSSLRPEKVKSRWRRNSELESNISESVSSLNNLSEISSLSDKDQVKVDKVSQNFILDCTEEIPFYTPIEDNDYLFERKKSKSKKQTKKMVCDCILTKEERSRGVMGCGEDCLNRMLMMECGSRCPLDDHCSNKRFNKRQYAKVEPCKTFKKGWGLRALENIPSHAFIMEYVGEVIDPFDFHERVEKYAKQKLEHHYFMALKADEIIDATCKGNITRFINHSCEPNSETQKWTVNGELRIGFFTTKPVSFGDEITFDYQFQRYGKKAQKCFCGSENCRGYIGGENANILTDGSRIPKTVSKEEDIDSDEEDEFLEDVGLEEEINCLYEDGLRNRKSILLLSRLMLRAEKCDLRLKLSDILMSTVQNSYLKLFLDYHGLQILWSWMVEPDLEVELKIKLLQLLEFLPITDKTMLTDSKVLSVVEKWSQSDHDHITDAAPSEEINKDQARENAETSQLASVEVKAEETNQIVVVDLKCDSKPEQVNTSICNGVESSSPTENVDDKELTGNSLDKTCKIVIKRKSQSADDSSPKKASVSLLFIAQSLLSQWKDLKHVFKIPRQEREKRQQDEEEADRRAQEDEERRANGLPVICDQTMNDDYATAGLLGTKRRCLKRLTDSSKDLSFRRNTSPQFLINSNTSSVNKMTKEEHRKMFEYNLAQNDYAEALKKYHEDLAIYNATYREQMLQKIQQIQALQSTDSSFVAPIDFQYSSDTTNSLSFAGALPYSGQLNSAQFQSFASLSSDIVFEDAAKEYTQLAEHLQPTIDYPELREIVPKFGCPLIVLANESLNFTNENCNLSSQAIDNVDYSQVRYDSDDLLESMEKKMFDEIYPPAGIFYITKSGNTYFVALPSDLSQTINIKENVTEPLDSTFTEQRPDDVMPPGWEWSTLGENTYYYNIRKHIKQWHPPQDSQIDAYDNAYDDSQPMDMSDLGNEFSQSNVSSPTGFGRKLDRGLDMSHEELSDVKRRNAKRIHEVFRTKVSQYVVKYLSHFNKNGRFSNSDDFKRLARKLSHNVVSKEGKHCKHTEDLAFTESVKLKTKEYIKRYMSKIGDVYKPDSFE